MGFKCHDCGLAHPIGEKDRLKKEAKDHLICPRFSMLWSLKEDLKDPKKITGIVKLCTFCYDKRVAVPWKKLADEDIE